MCSMPAIGLSPRQQKQRRRMSDAKHRASVAASYKQLQKVLPSTYDYHGVKEISRQTKIVRAAVSHINKLEETLDKILKLRACKFGDKAGYSKTLYMVRRQFREQFLHSEAIQAQSREKKTKKRVYQRKKKLVNVAELPTCLSVTESVSPRIVPSKVHSMTSTKTGMVHLDKVGVEVPSQISSSIGNQVKHNNEVRSHSSERDGPKIPSHGERCPTDQMLTSAMSDITKNTSTIPGTCTTKHDHHEVAGKMPVPSGSTAVWDATGPETVPRNHHFVTSTPKMLVRPATFPSPDPVRSYKEFEGYLLFYEHMVNQLQEQLLLPTQHLHSMQMSTTIQEIWKELPVGCRKAITSTATAEVPKAAKLSRMKAVVSVSMDRASLQRRRAKEDSCGEGLSTSSGKACSKVTACKLASPLPCEADFHKFLEQQGIELAQLVKDTSPTDMEGDYLDWSEDEDEENEYVVFLDDKMGFGNPQTCLMHCDAEVPTFSTPDVQEKKEHSAQVVPSADSSIKQEPTVINDAVLATNSNVLAGRKDTSAMHLGVRNVKKEPMWNGSSDGKDALSNKGNCPVPRVFGDVSPATGFRSPVLKDKSLARLPADGTYIWTVDVDEQSLDLDKIFKNGGKGKAAMLPQQQDLLRSPTYQSLLSSGFLPHPPTTPDSSHQVVPDLGSPRDMLTDRDGYGEFWSPEESLFSLEKPMEPLSEMDQSTTSHSLECEEDSRDLDDDDL